MSIIHTGLPALDTQCNRNVVHVRYHFIRYIRLNITGKPGVQRVCDELPDIYSADTGDAIKPIPTPPRLEIHFYSTRLVFFFFFFRPVG